MKSVADTLSPFAAYQELKHEQAELSAQHQHVMRDRAPLPPAAPYAWRRDHFIAAVTHDAHEALHKARLGAVYVKQPIAYVLGVIAEAALFGALVVVGLTFAAVGEVMAYFARSGPAQDDPHHFHFAVDVCIFGVYAPIHAAEHVLLSAIDAVVIVGAVAIGAPSGALCYAAGSRRYLRPAKEMPQPSPSASFVPRGPAFESRQGFVPPHTEVVDTPDLRVMRLV